MNILFPKSCLLPQPLCGFPGSSIGRGDTWRQQQKLHCTAPALNLSSSSTITARWAEFGEKVSGEWDGFGADFTAEGKPIELPESVVPEAFREWEVKVFDWQTQCPTTTQQHSLLYKTIRLLPTVGCEADAAATYTINDKNSHDSSAFAYHSTTGSYISLWPMELEHCLIDPRDKESRVRIIQVLQHKNSLKSISVYVEQWYGPFRNGEQLGGCGLRQSAFATTQPLQPSQVSGVWEGLTVSAKFTDSQNHMLELADERAFKSTTTRTDIDDALILLPNQLWCSLERSEDDTTCCQVGWLLDQGRRAITSKCTFSTTSGFMLLKDIALTWENATTILQNSAPTQT